MTRSPRFPFTRADVALSRREISQHFPRGDPLMIEYGVAFEVIINVFGPDWYGTRLAGSRPDAYIAKNRVAGLDAYIHQNRVIGLARDLMICQYLPGFAEQRKVMASRSLIAVYHELRMARLLHKSGHSVGFVVPSGERGADFDLRVDDFLATEVKAKEDDTEYTASSLRSSLSEARSQLPKEGPGLVALRIPDAWGADPTFANEADGVFRGALRNSRRINAILVLWDEWLERRPTGAACLTRFRVYENQRPRTGFSDLPRVIRSVLPAASAEEKLRAAAWPEHHKAGGRPEPR